MSLAPVYKKLQILKGLSGKAKETQFAQFVKEDHLFTKVVEYAVNPLKSYNIRKFQWYSIHAKANIGECFDYLDMLAGKRGASDDEMVKLSALASVDRLTHEVIHLILLKDLKCGIGLTLASKYIDSIKKHAVCLCDKDIDKFLKAIGYEVNRIAVSIKLDGVRVWATVGAGGDVTYLSRNGLAFKNFSKFDEDLKLWAEIMVKDIHNPVNKYPVIFDGEVIVTEKKFNALMGQVHRMVEVDTTHLKFSVFDCPSIPGNLIARQTQIQALDPVPTVEYHIHRRMRKPQTGDLKSALLELAGKAFEDGEEGLVIKDWNSPYEYKRTKFWCKLVATHTEDLYVTGQYPGEPGTKYENQLGGLYVDYKGVQVGVGSGFSDEERIEFVTNQPKMIEVAYREITPDGSLRFPRFKRVRNDKA